MRDAGSRLFLVLFAGAAAIGLWLWFGKSEPAPGQAASRAVTGAAAPDETQALQGLPGTLAPEPTAPKPARSALASHDSEFAESGQPLGVIEVELVSARSGDPLAGVVILCKSSAGEEVEVRSNAAGRASLAWPLGLEAGLVVEASSHAPAARVPVYAGETHRFVLQACGTIRGRMTWGNAAAPDDPRVLLWPSSRDGYRGEPSQEAEADAEGNFFFADVPPGEYGLVGRAGGCAAGTLYGVLVAADLETWAKLHLPRGSQLEVTVLDLEGQPFEGLAVSARPQVLGARSEFEDRVGSEGVTDEAGRCLLENLLGSTTRVEVLSFFGSRTVEEVSPNRSGQFEPLELRLRRPRVLEGRVVDETGSPAPGIAVHVENSRADPPLWAIADADGRFEFSEVPDHSILNLLAYPQVLRASGEEEVVFAELPLARARALRDSEDPILLKIQDRQSHAVRVLDTETGEPVEGAEIRFYDIYERTPSRAVSDRSWTTDQRGATTLEIPANLEGVLGVSAAGYRDGYLEVPTTDSAAIPFEPLEVKLRPREGYPLRFVDEQGQAVQDARLLVRDERSRERGSRPDEFGRFVLDEDAPLGGEMSIDSRAWRLSDWGPQTLGAQLEYSDAITLVPADHALRATVRGEVVHAVDGTALEDVRLRGAQGATVEFLGSRFHASGLLPGLYRIGATADDCETRYWGEFQLLPSADVELGRLELFPTSSVTFRFRDDQGAELIGPRVYLEPLSLAVGGVGKDREELTYRSRRRTLRVEAPRAAWRVRVQFDGFRTKTQRVDLRTEKLVEMVLKPAPQPELQPSDEP